MAASSSGEASFCRGEVDQRPQLKNDPGIEQLKKDVKDSLHIKQIQPNFIYTIQ
jgi:hypothetical protein